MRCSRYHLQLDPVIDMVIRSLVLSHLRRTFACRQCYSLDDGLLFEYILDLFAL